MTMSDWLLPASIVLATGALALGYGLGGMALWVLPIVALGGLWLLALWRRLAWAAWLGLALYAALAAAGLLLGLAGGWMLLGLVAALAAWDLDWFLHRLKQVGWVAEEGDLARRHHLRLLLVLGLGLLPAAVALELELDLGFGIVLLLGSLAIFGLSRAVGFLRRESD